MTKLGKVAYEAYCQQTGWKSLATGQDLPKWVDLRAEIKEAWDISAHAVFVEVVGWYENDKKD